MPEARLPKPSSKTALTACEVQFEIRTMQQRFSPFVIALGINLTKSSLLRLT